MDAPFAEVLTDLQSLARARGWHAVAERADVLLRAAAAPVLVAAADGADPSRLAEWVGRAAGVAVEKAALESLGADATRAAGAERLLAAFPCGRVPADDALGALLSALCGRPARSFAVVLTGAEQIADDSDLGAVERFAWRLLVPGPKADWDGQRLADHGVYLWSENPPAGFLAERLRADGAALTRHLGEPVRPGSLDRCRAAAAVAFAEAELLRAVPPTPAADPEPPPFPLQESLIDLRRRVLARTSSDAAALEQTLMVGLHTLRQDLRDGLASHLARLRLPRRGEAAARRAADEVSRYIADGLRDWQSRAAASVAEWGRAADADRRDRFDMIDWATVNRLAARAGRADDYPEALYRRLAALGGDAPELEAPAVAAPAARPGRLGTPLLRAALAGGVLPVLAWLGGAGPVGVVAAGVGGAIAGGAYGTSTESAHALQDWLAAGRAAIGEALDRAEQAVREQLAVRRDQVRRTLQDEFDQLDRVVTEGAADDGALGRSRRDLAALEDLHRRLLAIP